MGLITALLGVVGVFSLISIMALVRGFVLSVLWQWFISDVFHVQPITVLQALGISLILGVFLPIPQNNNEKKDPLEVILTVIITPLVALLFGWLLKLVM